MHPSSTCMADWGSPGSQRHDRRQGGGAGRLWAGLQLSLNRWVISGPSSQRTGERNSRRKAWREPLRAASCPGAGDRLLHSSEGPAPSAWPGQSQEETDGGRSRAGRGRGEAELGGDAVGWSRQSSGGRAPRPSLPPTATAPGPVSQAPHQQASRQVWPGAGTRGRLGCGGEKPGHSSPSLCPVWRLHRGSSPGLWEHQAPPTLRPWGALAHCLSALPAHS